MKEKKLSQVQQQVSRIKQSAEKSFEAQKEEIKIKVQAIQLPLSTNDEINLYKWLGRKQITAFEIPSDVLKEFKTTTKYQSLIKQGLINLI